MQKQNKLGLFWKLCAKKIFFQESRIADTIMPKVECVRVPVKKKKIRTFKTNQKWVLSFLNKKNNYSSQDKKK